MLPARTRTLTRSGICFGLTNAHVEWMGENYPRLFDWFLENQVIPVSEDRGFWISRERIDEAHLKLEFVRFKLFVYRALKVPVKNRYISYFRD
jgi:hypothetical protein